MKGKYDYDIIRDYLHGLVDQETSHRIRDLIRTDEVARNIAAGILQLEHEFHGEDDEIESYIETLRQKQLTLIREQGKERKMSPGWIRVAAAILIIAVAAFVLWLTVFRNSNNNMLAAELNTPYPLATLDRGSPGESGFKFYIEGDYKNAIASFDSISNDVSVTFYNGMSHLYGGEYDQAVTLLRSSSLEASRYREQVSWFEVLALIKAGRNDEAKEGLKRISADSSHYKSGAARQLLEELD
ncbi:MAG TPA: hypothetical protein VK508_14650 [Cyclobacteriaceae bacterium]|nr:hypothetical protein [Cyclobacteriaceae bacterium]